MEKTPQKKSSTPNPIIRFENVSKTFGAQPILEHAEFIISAGEFISIVGPSGAGKSTILKLIYAEEEPSEGTIYFDGRPIRDIKRKHLPYYRRNIGTIFQDFKLFPRKTIGENIAYALEVDGYPSEEIKESLMQILEIVGLADKAHRFPKELSGGEQQRVSIARALITRPKVIVADEPTGNLDPLSAEGIINLLLEINAYGTTVILATHNKTIVDSLARRVITIDQGRIIRDENKGTYHLNR
ncbi:MAG: ATP-binding cassette domain-containing protein [Candidatus Moraniibacteriota bacterium]